MDTGIDDESAVQSEGTMPLPEFSDISVLVDFRLPTFETIKVNIGLLMPLFIRDLKQKLSREHTRIPASKMKLVFKNRGLEDREIVEDTGIQGGDIVYVVLSLAHSEPYSPKYDDFVLSVSPRHLAINVPVDTSIVIILRQNVLDHAIYTDGLRGDALIQPHYEGNMIQALGNEVSLAQGKGFVQWTESLVSDKVLLLKVDESLDLRLDDIRYDVDGINGGYDRGDRHSWQRYTRHWPVECDISLSHYGDPLPHTVRLQPCVPLQPNTQYAIVLCNNVPVLPLSFPHYSVECCSESVGDDKVFVFKTETRAVHASGHRMHHHHHHGHNSSQGGHTGSVPHRHSVLM